MVGKRVLGVLLIAAIYSVVLREELYFIEAKEEGYKSDAKLWRSKPSVVESQYGVVATDDGRCSEVGKDILERGGNAVDAAVAAALCLGVVSPTSSGIGGGGFMLVRDSKSQETKAFNMRETAPSAASRDMYANDPKAKSSGPMSVGVPGELAGLYSAWKRYGKLKQWRDLVEPAIKYAREGFVISPFTGSYLPRSNQSIMNDPGLSEVFVRNGTLLKAGDTCYNLELANTLEAIAELGPKALYDGPIGEKLIDELQKAGGIVTNDDLRNYRAKVTEPASSEAFGFVILGVPPPSSGASGMSMVLNILDGYGSKVALRDPVGLHRSAEAMKHMYAKRLELGDPDFEDVDETVSNMLSSSFAEIIRGKIQDHKTFNAEHYGARSSQVVDHGTSHIIVVDKDRNVVSMTTSLNDCLGGGIRSRSTGIILNNAMGDFSTPTDETTHDNLTRAETNLIEPNKRPLSSMTPTIVLKDNQFAGAIGCGGGPNIIAAVIQIFINHFVLEMEALAAVESPRIYHSIDPETVCYENWTVYSGKHFELPEEKRQSLIRRGHKLKAEGGAICQLVVESVDDSGHKILTAVSDPRKGGWPEAASVGSHQTLNAIFYFVIFVLVAYKVLPRFRNFVSWYFPAHLD